MESDKQKFQSIISKISIYLKEVDNIFDTNKDTMAKTNNLYNELCDVMGDSIEFITEHKEPIFIIASMLHVLYYYRELSVKEMTQIIACAFRSGYITHQLEKEG